MIRSLSVIWRTPRYRSLAGLAVAVAMLPVLLGIVASLQTPVGDPERSRVDPRLTGIWLSGESGDSQASDSAAAIWIFEPYDARSWLFTYVGCGHAADAPSAAAAPSQQCVDVLHILAALRDRPPHAASVTLFKAWLTTLGGQRFLVLEPKAEPTGKRGFRPKYWFALRVQQQGAQLLLSFVRIETEHLGQTTSRSKAEQIIAQHAAEADCRAGPRLCSTLLRVVAMGLRVVAMGAILTAVVQVGTSVASRAIRLRAGETR
jgi:hypothetical protein